LQSLRQQAHLIGRPPLNLLFQQNRPIAAGDDWQLPGQSGVSVHVLQHGAGSSSRLAEHS